jgi:hypothetical protein
MLDDTNIFVDTLCYANVDVEWSFYVVKSFSIEM